MFRNRVIMEEHSKMFYFFFYAGETNIPMWSSRYFDIIFVPIVFSSYRKRLIVINQDVTGSERFSQFLASVDFIEGETGLDFLAGLEDRIENEVESRRAPSLW